MTQTNHTTIAIAAGGTGGHLFPAQAVAELLLEKGYGVVLLTDERGQKIAPNFPANITHVLPSGGLAGVSLFKRLGSAMQLAWGTFKARRLLKSIKPGIVIGFGGYPSVPPMLAAKSLGIPSLLHEQNAFIGKANRLLAKFCDQVALPFEPANMKGLTAEAKQKCFVAGNPVRKAFQSIRPQTNDADGRLNLLVLGGSLGAHVMSQEVPKAISLLDESQQQLLTIVQQARGEDLQLVEEAYEGLNLTAVVRDFFDNVDELIADSDLLISRAGASTVAEITTAGRASILVPYPFAADDHQTQNATALANNGAAILVPQPEFTAEFLTAKISECLNNKQALVDMGQRARALAFPDAAHLIADATIRLIKKESAS